MTDTPGFSPLYKGYNYVADIYGSFAQANSTAAASDTNPFDGVLADNANAVALTMDFGIDAENNTIYDNDVDGGYTESDSNLATTITYAKHAGLSVLVRPLIDFLPANYDTDPGGTNALNGDYYNDEFRNYYNPGAPGSTGANDFFTSYQAMIVQEAKVAQADGAQVFDIGTELDQLTGPAYNSTANPYWNNIITAVKAVFHGKLTYSAVWDDSQGYWKYSGNFTDAEQGSTYITGDLTTQVSFWSQLDYVGIDEYAAVSDASPATLDAMSFSDEVAALVKGWTETPTDSVVSAVTGGESLIDYYEGISQATGKPLLFTEIGYGDASDAASVPATPGYDDNGNLDGAVADPTLQAALYAAFFDAWAQDGNSSLAGVYVWEYEPNGSAIVPAGTALYDNNGNETYNPYPSQGQAGETAIAAGYAECFLAGTRIAVPGGEIDVEALRIGDLVTVRDGRALAVQWIGRRRYDPRFVKHNHLILPVHIAPGALADGVPARELVVSPGHGIYLSGVLVPAWRLINGVSITQPARAAEIDYFHIELPTHEVLLAESCPAESFVDAQDRRQFENSGEAGPGDKMAPLPRVESGFLLHAIQARLAALAGISLPMAGGSVLHGHIEAAGPAICRGWVRDVQNPQAPVCLDILACGRRVARVLANQYRADVRAAGFGDGCCGFEVALPVGITGDVEVRGAAQGAQIAWLDKAA